jgi:hypothetical protein
MSDEERERKALSLARLKRAKQHLKSARDLVRDDDFADSVSRSYYGCEALLECSTTLPRL